MRNINLLCFTHYNLGHFGRVGNRIVVYSSIIIYSPDLLVFARWWSFKLLSLCILCNKYNFSGTPPGNLPGVPSLFHVLNDFTVKRRRSVRISCQCDTNWAGYFTLDARASRPVSSCNGTYRKTSNISRTLAGNKIVDNSNVVGASPVGAAPTTSSFST